MVWQTSKPTLVEIDRMLLVLSRRFSQVVLFIDAVNESQYSKLVIESLTSLALGNRKLRIMVTTTTGSDLHKLYQFATIKPMNPELIESDIKVYIDARLTSDINLSNKSETLKNVIRTKLLERANGI
jgi:hypothetical protein